MKIFITSFFLILLNACVVKKEINFSESKIVVLKDSIKEPYVYLNELSFVSNNQELTKLFNKEIQKLSENIELTTEIPLERLSQKKALLKKCINNKILECNYTPESYSVLNHEIGFVNIKYSYNSFMSADEWFKYAVFYSNKPQRLTYDLIFTNSELMLKLLNRKYLEELNSQLKEPTLEEYELDIIKDHIDSRELFKLKDLNNLELVYNSIKKITHFKFHYNGLGGVYKSVISYGEVEFSIDEIKGNFTEEFKKRLSIE